MSFQACLLRCLTTAGYRATLLGSELRQTVGADTDNARTAISVASKINSCGRIRSRRLAVLNGVFVFVGFLKTLIDGTPSCCEREIRLSTFTILDAHVQSMAFVAENQTVATALWMQLVIGVNGIRTTTNACSLPRPHSSSAKNRHESMALLQCIEEIRAKF